MSLQLVHNLLQGLQPGDAERLSARVISDHLAETGQHGEPAQLAARAWALGSRAMHNAHMGRRVCRICGCWELEACDDGCWWVEQDLCSSCP